MFALFQRYSNYCVAQMKVLNNPYPMMSLKITMGNTFNLYGLDFKRELIQVAGQDPFLLGMEIVMRTSGRYLVVAN